LIATPVDAAGDAAAVQLEVAASRKREPVEDWSEPAAIWRMSAELNSVSKDGLREAIIAKGGIG
jgi:hypothetical protein